MRLEAPPHYPSAETHTWGTAAHVDSCLLPHVEIYTKYQQQQHSHSPTITHSLHHEHRIALAPLFTHMPSHSLNHVHISALTLSPLCPAGRLLLDALGRLLQALRVGPRPIPSFCLLSCCI